MKNITPAEAARFWNSLRQYNPEMYWRLKRHVLAPGDVVCLKPITMDDEDYNIYKRHLNGWLIENGFIEGNLHLTSC